MTVISNPDLVDLPVAPLAPTAEFSSLVRLIKAEGLLEKRTAIYIPRIAGTAAIFLGGWAAFALVGNSWWQMVVAVSLAFAFTQTAFLAHDAGHNQAFPSRRGNDRLLLITGNFAVGLASGWWFKNHNAHHAHPNNTALDPDVGLRYYAYSPEQSLTKRGIDRLMSKYQHHLYFPSLTLLGFNYRLESVLQVVKRGVKRPVLEGALLAAHFVLYFGALFTVLSPGKAIAFLVVHQALFGLYLGSTFASNHKGMEMFEGKEPSFLERQVRSSRNVTGGPVIDYLLGGLNLQIEHHLFPAMPRPNLLRAKPIVENFCHKNGLPYEEQTVTASYRSVRAYFRSNRAH